jgi:hypothetical protein
MAPPASLEYNLKAWVSGSLTRPRQLKNKKLHDFGLDLEQDADDGQFYITRVEGLAKELDGIRVGDRLFKFQGKDPSEFTTGDALKEIRRMLRTELTISFETLHPEILHESITEIEMDIETGDVIPLTSMKEEEALNGKDAQILRGGKDGQWLVQVLETGAKMIVHSSNLQYEVIPEKIQLREPVEEDAAIVEDSGAGAVEAS